MAYRFQDIIAEELGFPTTADKKRALHEWEELKAVIDEVDQNYEYSPDWLWYKIYRGANVGFPVSGVYIENPDMGLSIDDIVSAHSMISSGLYVPNTLLMSLDTWAAVSGIITTTGIVEIAPAGENNPGNPSGITVSG